MTAEDIKEIVREVIKTENLELTELEKGIWIKGVDFPNDYFTISFAEGGIALEYRNVVTGVNNGFLLSQSGVTINDQSPTSRGISADRSYSENILDNDFVQKSYVDSQKGVLENKTTAEILAIENSKIGKQFFNLDNNCICYFNGSDWKKVISENL